MVRQWLFILLISLSGLLQAKEADFYQIDLLVFRQPDPVTTELPHSFIGNVLPSAIPLRAERGRKAYRLLPISASHLQKEYWILKHQPQYQVLLHYSWLQPLTNRQAIIIPRVSQANWQIEGSVRVERANYYLFAVELLFSPLTEEAPFTLTQKQRLKEDKLYYLDHPQVGMLVKIHRVV